MAIFSSTRQKLLVNGLLVLIGLVLLAFVSLRHEQPKTEQDRVAAEAQSQYETFQSDADIIRLRHLKYWVAAIEDYKDNVGQYPLQEDADMPVQVVIATPSQAQALADQNISPFLNSDTSHVETRTMQALINELETGLGREVKAYVDPQMQLNVENPRPNAYTYRVNNGVYTFAIHTYQNYLFGKYLDTHFHQVEVSNVGNPSANLVMTPQTLFNSSHYRIAAGKELTNPSAFVEQVDEAVLNPNLNSSKKPQSMD